MALGSHSSAHQVDAERSEMETSGITRAGRAGRKPYSGRPERGTGPPPHEASLSFILAYPSFTDIAGVESFSDPFQRATILGGGADSTETSSPSTGYLFVAQHGGTMSPVT